MHPIMIEEILARPADWVSEDGAASFWLGGPFMGGMTWVGRWEGTPPWTCHPDGDALFHNVRGRCSLSLLTGEGEIQREVEEGAYFVIPQGIWHRFRSDDEVLQWGTAPGDTQHSVEDDPRDIA